MDLQLAFFKGLFTEDETVAGKAIFEGGLDFSTSEARKNLDSTASAYRGELGEQLGSKYRE